MSKLTKRHDRRAFLKASAYSALGVLASSLACRPQLSHARYQSGLGPLKRAPGGLLSLPKGFRYVVVQEAGAALSDGFKMPPQPDGMACFNGPKGELILLRNHELGDAEFIARWGKELLPYPDGKVPTPHHRQGVYGGVTRVVLDPQKLDEDFARRAGKTSRAIAHSNLVLCGTDKNCAGGVVQGGWVSCEESSREGHGYAFMTRPEDGALHSPRRLDSWGRMQREAVAHDPKSGIIYMTEDHKDAAFYRFVPINPNEPTGKGHVDALVIKGLPHTHPYTHTQGSTQVPRHWEPKKRWNAHWVRVPDPSARELPCREQAAALGATRFRRTEGITIDDAGVWFVASTGGCAHAGQLFRFIPRGASKGELVLEYEVSDRRILSSPDNIVMTPWGELLLAEDNYESGGGVVTHQFLRIMNAEGGFYDLARNNARDHARGTPGAEFTGACFSPDGRTLFVNLQNPTQMTLAIQGPWPRAKAL